MVMMVRAPRRPMNIIAVMMYLLASHRSGVMPVERPPVPKAEVSSINTGISEKMVGRSSAMAVVFFFLVLVVAVIQLYFSRKREESLC